MLCQLILDRNEVLQLSQHAIAGLAQSPSQAQQIIER